MRQRQVDEAVEEIGAVHLSRFLLLAVVYYLNASANLIDPAVAALAPWQAIAISLASIIAGWAENWFVWHRLDSAIAWNPRSIALLGATRAQRWAAWWRRNVSGLAANVSLGLMLGLVPAIAGFFALPIEVRHVTLSTGQLAAAVGALGAEGGVAEAGDPVGVEFEDDGGDAEAFEPAVAEGAGVAEFGIGAAFGEPSVAAEEGIEAFHVFEVGGEVAAGPYLADVEQQQPAAAVLPDHLVRGVLQHEPCLSSREVSSR